MKNVKVFTRRCHDWTKRFRKIVHDAFLISSSSAIIDGDHACSGRYRRRAHFAFASEASRANLKAFSRSRLSWKARCARSCSVMALAASASLNTLRASRAAGVIAFRSNVSLILNPWLQFSDVSEIPQPFDSEGFFVGWGLSGEIADDLFSRQSLFFSAGFTMIP
jgi:hypothetical protein